MTTNTGVQDRVWLWEQNSAVALKAWRQQGSDGNLAIILTDLNDRVGRAITTAIAQHQGTEQELNKLILGTRGLIPTSYMIMAREDLSTLLARNNPGISQRLRNQPPPGYVYAVSIAAGGTTLMQVPVDYA
jgi:hypothetical protein